MCETAGPAFPSNPLLEARPDPSRQVLGRGRYPREIGPVAIQVLVIQRAIDLLLQDSIDVRQIHDHRGLRIDLPLPRDLEPIVVAITVRALLAVDREVLLGAPVWPPKTSAGVEVNRPGEAHAKSVKRKTLNVK